MSDSTQKSETDVVTQAAIDPGVPTPTVTHYELLANDFLKALDTLGASLPVFEAKHDTTVKFVRSKMAIPLKFLQTAVAAVEQTPALTAVNKLDATKARDTLQFIGAFSTVVDKVTAFAQALQFTINSRRAVLASEALHMYEITKGVARDPGEALGAFRHLGNMARDLGRTKPKSKSKTAPTTTPAPQHPATPATPATPAPQHPVSPATPALPIAV